MPSPAAARRSDATLPAVPAPLDAAFFARPTLTVARELLGCVLVHDDPDAGRVAGRIVETEAYLADDPAYHGWKAVDATGLVSMTGRTRDLFGPPGRAYLYAVYDRHWMLNLVTEPEGVCGSVLVRALEPLDGLAAMFERRVAARRARDLCNGPGKLTAALGLDSTAFHGADVTGGPNGKAGALRVEPGEALPFETTARIGLTRGTELPYRFVVPGHPCVSPGVPSDLAAARRRARR